MINYQKHKDRLKRGSLKVIEPGEDYGKQWLHDAQGAQRELFEDFAELLDKAEERDKYRKALESLRHIYSTAFSPDEVIGSAQLACEVVRKALGDSESYL